MHGHQLRAIEPNKKISGFTVYSFDSNTAVSKSIDDYKINAEKATSTNATIMTVIFMLVIPFGLVIVAVIVYKLRKNL